MNTNHLTLITSTAPVMCSSHRAYEADYCPVCGTAQVIGANGATTSK